VVVALLGIGSILWFVLGRNNSLTAHLPFSGALNGSQAAIDANGNGLNSTGLAHGAKPGDTTAVGPTTTGVTAKAANGGTNPADVAADLGAAAGIGAVANNAVAPVKVNPATIQSAAPAAASASPAAAPTVAAVPSPEASPTTVAASPKVVVDAPLPKPTQAAQFSDVPSTAAIAPYVTALSSRGLMSGFKDNTFQPDKPITRAEFAGILQKAFEKQRVKPALSFNDIKADAPDVAAITEATQTGFMNGFPDKSFKPNLQIPRYQMQVALVTGLGLNPSGDPAQALSAYADAQELPKWSIAKVATAVQSGIIAPDTKGLDPNHPATRGDAVVLIHQALVKDGKLPAIK
jgi:S-layer homology domain